jgi:hypothetical protein
VTTVKPARLRALERARRDIKAGVKEDPPRSNWSPRIKQYLATTGLNYPKPPGAPWCMAAVSWCYAMEGVDLGGGASVGFFEAWAAKHGMLFPDRPFAGDIVCYRFDADNWPDHVGIVDRVLAVRWRGKVFAGWLRVAEGNTAVGNDANGGKYMFRYRWAKRTKFVRFVEPPL